MLNTRAGVIEQCFQPFMRQPHKMVKHTQTSCRLLPTSCLSVFDLSVGLAHKELMFPLGFISQLVKPENESLTKPFENGRKGNCNLF